jgi:MFS family permease
MLIATRALQGLGGAMMTPVARLILLRSFPRSQLVTAMTYMTLPAIIGPLIGPLLGGVLTTYASWRWIFFVNVPFGIAGAIMALRFIDDVREDEPSRFDFPGFLMVGAGLVLLQYGMENIGRPTIPIPVIAGVILAAIQLLAGFTRYARTVAAPAIDLTLFNLRSFRIGTLVGGLCRVGFNGVPAADAAGRLGHEPVASGSLTFVSALSALAVRPVLVFVLRMYGFKRVLMGSATPERFHRVFLMMAVIPLLTLPGFMFLRREDGVQVSGRPPLEERNPPPL